MIVTVVIILITILNVIVHKLRQLQEANLDAELNIPASLQHSCRRFSFVEIQSATNNFDDALVLGKGGFGKVYKGIIDNGAATVAIKRLNPMSKQGAPEFWREIDMLSKIRHSHIVSLVGYCNHRDEMMVVYEYMVGGTIADHLHKIGRNGDHTCTLSWVQRLKICIGAAQGLDYLHTGMGIKDRVIHRDVKSSNILLDENWAAKISDFGLSKIGPANQSTTHVSTNVKGSFGYFDPEYFLTNRLTRKSDVYSFGVVLFEVLCGRPAVDFRLDGEQRGLARWAHHCIKEGKLYQIIDPDLTYQILPDSLMAFEKIADRCLHNFSQKRPTMAEVVVALERALALQERKHSSMFEEEIFNTHGAYDHQLKADSYTEENDIINVDSLIEHREVIKTGDDMQNELKDEISPLDDERSRQKQMDEHIDRMIPLNDAKSSQSRVNPTKTRAFTRKLRMFFFSRAQGTPGKLEKKEVSPEKAIPPRLVFFEGCNLKFDLEDLLRASAEVLSKGTCGTAYKVMLDNVYTVVVRRLKQMHVRDSMRQFKKQMEVMESIKHQNVVQPMAYYCSEEENFTVYDYYSEGSIADMLHGAIGKNKIPFNWESRLRIAIGSARGIAHIHVANGMKLVHGNIKSSNIFLNSQFYGCVSDLEFSLIMSPLVPDCSPRASYQAPEVTDPRKATQPSDVYSFGMLLMELLTGKSPMDVTARGEVKDLDLVQWVHSIDPDLRDQILPDSLMAFEKIADQCLNYSSKKRPTMAEVVVALERALVLQERRNSFMFEEDIFDTHGAYDNRVMADSHTEQHDIINADSFIEQEVIDESRRQTQIDEHIDRMIVLDDEKIKTSAFRRKLKMFNFSRARGTPGKSEKEEMSLEKAMIRNQKVNTPGLFFFEGYSYRFDLKALLRAPAEELEKGTLGSACKVMLEDGTTVVMKRLKEVPVRIGRREFEQQMEVVGSIKHQNVVQPRAYYCSDNEKITVYDYYSEGSVALMLHGQKGENKIPLNWETRKRIAIGAARGIAQIHEANKGKLVHGNIKSSNIFLNSQQYGCVSDLDLLSLMMPMDPPINRAASGYKAPELTGSQRDSQPSDVYSFGVFLLELLTGKIPIYATDHNEAMDFVDWVHWLIRNEVVHLIQWKIKLFDSKLIRCPEEQMLEMWDMLQIAMACVVRVSEERPKMVQVVEMIENIQ